MIPERLSFRDPNRSSDALRRARPKVEHLKAKSSNAGTRKLQTTTQLDYVKPLNNDDTLIKTVNKNIKSNNTRQLALIELKEKSVNIPGRPSKSR